LKTDVETVARHARGPHTVGAQPDPADELLRFARLTYGADDRGRPAHAAQMLQDEPPSRARSAEARRRPTNPPHLLLKAGADPNDDQTIYNRHLRPDEHIELLLAHGLGKSRRGPWPERPGDHLVDAKLLAEDALVFVADDDADAHRVASLHEFAGWAAHATTRSWQASCVRPA
jgi:hypothetical protein